MRTLIERDNIIRLAKHLKVCIVTACMPIEDGDSIDQYYEARIVVEIFKRLVGGMD